MHALTLVVLLSCCRGPKRGGAATPIGAGWHSGRIAGVGRAVVRQLAAVFGLQPNTLLRLLAPSLRK